MTFQYYSAVDYLKIDIASNYGDYEGVDLEKLDFPERIEWFDRMERDGKLVQLISSAEKPALFFSGLEAYNDYLNGEPSGYPISLDACSSGLQILAVFANCAKSALRCGVLSTGHREDAYTSLFVDMQNAATFKLSASRSDMKQSIMTALYGSTAMPKKIFGAGTDALKLFYHTVETEIPGAWALNKALKGLWQPFASEHEWQLPDGFEVSMVVEDTVCDVVQFGGKDVEVYTKQTVGTPKGLSLSPNIVHSIDGMICREIVRRCDYDAKQIERVKECINIAIKRKDRRKSTMGHGRKKDLLLEKLWKLYLRTGFFSARVLDLIDEKNINMVSAYQIQELVQTLPAKPFKVLTIHDCFRVLPNYGNDIRMQYNIILSELAKSTVLDDIATQITGVKKRLKKVGDISADILNANYALS